MPRAARPVLVALLGALLLIPGATAALAHTRLLSITPADNARLTESPENVVLTFNEDMKGPFSKVVVTDDQGKDQTSGPPSVKGGVVTQPLAVLAPGHYTVRYRVVSADGHPVAGISEFTVLTPAGTTATPTPSTPAPSTAASSGALPAPTEDGGGWSRGLLGGVAGLAVFGSVLAFVTAVRRQRAGD